MISTADNRSTTVSYPCDACGGRGIYYATDASTTAGGPVGQHLCGSCMGSGLGTVVIEVSKVVYDRPRLQNVVFGPAASSAASLLDAEALKKMLAKRREREFLAKKSRSKRGGRR